MIDKAIKYLNKVVLKNKSSQILNNYFYNSCNALLLIDLKKRPIHLEYLIKQTHIFKKHTQTTHIKKISVMLIVLLKILSKNAVFAIKKDPEIFLSDFIISEDPRAAVKLSFKYQL